MDRAETDKNGHNPEEGGLTVRQRKAILYLASARTWDAGCRAARIGRTTLTSWMKQPEFIKELRRAEEIIYRDGLDRIQRGTGEAAEVLRGLLRSGQETIRLRAASELLGFGLKAREAIEIEERLAALEARASGGRSY